MCAMAWQAPHAQITLNWKYSTKDRACTCGLRNASHAGLKQQWLIRLGETGYKLSFAILIVASLVLIVLGWRSSIPSHVYQLPGSFRHIAFLLLVIAFLFFGAANYPSRIKHYIRHPQLTGVMTWSVAHLLLNGDRRSILLFSWMGIWAALEIAFINRREGKWEKPAVPGWGLEVKGAAISLAILIAAVLAHPYFAGVPVR